MGIKVSVWDELGVDAQSALLERPALRVKESHLDEVGRIVAMVRRNGDSALFELSRKLDDAKLDSLRVDKSEFAAAAKQLDDESVAAIDLAITNVRRFHEQQIPGSISIETSPGVRCERISHAIDSVGLYVPAGTAPLPSAAVMLAVPAAIAGCPTRVMCTPPRPDGRADPAVLVAASRSGVEDVFKIGGAQAIAAMAYGTESVPKVRKIFGPGNAWVTAAKTLVSADPAGASIDMPAGPTEVLIIADEDASPEFVAADLLSQAEHGVDSQVMLLTTSKHLVKKVQLEIGMQMRDLSRADIARECLENSHIIVVESREMAIDISNRYAPEHLIMQISNPRDALRSIRNAGSVFLGEWSPESVGDYCSGTNHVLPTYGYAGSHSGLGVDQFLRQTTVQELTKDGLAQLGDAVIKLAGIEGLDAHAAAVARRLAGST